MRDSGHQMRHGEEDDRDGQGRSDPQPQTHPVLLTTVHPLMAWRLDLHLQRHTADRTITGMITLDLWMHWAGVIGRSM
jgi:hypothetical protein